MITSEGIEEIAQFIMTRADHGSYDLNGVTSTTPIYKTSFEGDTVMIYLYIEDGVSGDLSNFKLISTTGNDFAIKPEIINKPNTKGLLVRFKYRVKEEIINVI